MRQRRLIASRKSLKYCKVIIRLKKRLPVKHYIANFEAKREIELLYKLDEEILKISKIFLTTK